MEFNLTSLPESRGLLGLWGARLTLGEDDCLQGYTTTRLHGCGLRSTDTEPVGAGEDVEPESN